MNDRMRDLFRKTKRGFAFLLTLVMLLTCSNVNVYAAELEQTDASNIPSESELNNNSDESNDAEDEDVTGIVSNLDGIVTSLENMKSDAGKFYAELKTDGTVKLAWKSVSGAKKYKLYRVKTDGSTCSTELLAETSKKTYTDETVFDDEEATNTYVLCQYDKSGTEVSRLATVATSYIMSVQSTGDEAGSVGIYFADQKGAVSYKIERSTDKKFAEGKTQSVVIDQTGGKIIYKTYAGKLAAFYLDEEANLLTGKLYYRITPQIVDEAKNIEIYAKTGAAEVVTRAFEAPEIVSINGVRANGESRHEDETACYLEGYVWVKFPDSYEENNINVTKLQLVRTDKKGKTKALKTIAMNHYTLQKDTFKGEDVYGIPYNAFYPEQTFAYRVRAVAGKLSSAYSAPMDYTVEFPEVEPVNAEAINQVKIKLTWETESCAASYTIYRSNDSFDTEEEAMDAAETMQMSDMKKLGSVKNKKYSSGKELSYTDSKLPAAMTYFVYKVVPVNNKVYGFKQAADLTARSHPVSPTTVTVKSSGLEKLIVTWNASYKATEYTVQRTKEVDENGTPVFDESAEGWFEGVYDSKSKVFKDRSLTQYTTNSGSNGIEAGETYYYRVLAACKGVDGNVYAPEEEDNINYGSNYTKPYKLSGLKYTFENCAKDDVWSYKSNGTTYHHSIRLTFETKSDRKAITYYELQRAEDSTLESAYKTIKNISPVNSKGTYYTTITVRDDNAGVGLTRGVEYHYRVRPVYKNGDKIINGDWVTKRFCMPTEVRIKYDGDTSSSHNGSSSSKAYRIKKGETKRFYMNLEPLNASYKEMDVTLSNTTYFSIVKKGEVKEGKNKGKYYVEVKSNAQSTSTTAYIKVFLKNSKDKSSNSGITDKFYISGN